MLNKRLGNDKTLRMRGAKLATQIVIVFVVSLNFSAGAIGSDNRYEIHIEADTLGQALEELVDTTGIQMLYHHDLAGTTEINPVDCECTVEEALDVILSNTNLFSGLTESGVIVISRDRPNRVSKNEGVEVKNTKIKQGLFAGIASLFAGAEVGHTQEVDTGARLEEIVITAQRREESSQSVPIAVSAFSGNALDNAGVDNLEELSAITPGLLISGSRGGSTPYLRGVGTRDVNAGITTSVATYVDGVYYMAGMAGSFSFNNIDRVEVIKGPQGTLFGQSATGGLIHILTKDPSQEATGSIKASYGNFDTSIVSAYYSQGIAENLAADISIFSHHQGEGFGQNLVSGSDANQRREWQVRSKWLWTPSEDTRVTASFAYGEDKNDFGHVRTIEPGTFGLAGTPNRGTPWDVQINFFEPEHYRQNHTVSLKVDHQFGDINFLSTTAIRHVEASNPIDQDSTPVRIVDAGFDPEKSDTVQQEFLFSGGKDTFDWTVGAIYFTDDSEVSPVHIQTPGTVPNRLDRFAEQSLHSYAVFGQATMSLTDTTRLTLGLRNTWDTRKISGYDTIVSSVNDGAFTQVTDVIVTTPTQTQEEDWSEPTWRIALDHDLGDQTLLYASYSRGYKQGAYSILSYTNPPVNPEILDAYEVGFKYDTANGRLRANGSIFFYDHQDLQISKIVAGGASLLNAAKSEVFGAELDVTWQASANLQLTGALSLLDDEFKDFQDAEAYLPNPPAVGGNSLDPNYVAEGQSIPFTPDYTINLRADYSVPVSTGSVDFALMYNYTDDVPLSVDQRVMQEGYGIVNTRIGFSSRNGWTISAFANNLTDETYLVQTSYSNLGSLVRFGNPRTYAVELEFDF